MRSFLTAVIMSLITCNAMAAVVHHSRATVKPQDTYGPYYLGVSGACDVFEVWLNVDTQVVYGKEIGCSRSNTGQPVIGTFDSQGYDVYISAAGGKKASILDFDLYGMGLYLANSDGTSDSENAYDITLTEEAPAEGDGPSVLQ